LKKLLSYLKVAALPLLALYFVTGLTLSSHITSAAVATHYGTIQGANITDSRVIPQVAVPVLLPAISDAEAKAQAGNPQLAAHMLHRVTKPLAIQPQVGHYVNVTSSTNWGGYYVQSTNVEGSYGCVVDTKAPTYDAASWTGVGGVNGTGDLAQSGVDQYEQEGWIETYPNPPVFYFNVNTGDTVCSEVKYVSSGKWYISVTDSTSGSYYAADYSFNPDRSTAEWITEAQGSAAVPRFGSITFTSTEWWNSSGNEVSATTGGTLYDIQLHSPVQGSICPGNESGTSFTNSSTRSSSC
jgi:Peptidase A4 family